LIVKTKMNITLELKSGLKKYIKKPTNNNIIELNLKDNSRISDVVNQLSIPKEYIALVTINKKTSNLNSGLKDNDKVVFYPPIGGG
jgi:molybdopterin converting factor small subunit